jgi:nitroreductase
METSFGDSMAKSIQELALSRCTTYDFSKKQVPSPKLQRLLEAARWAPSALNAQPWRFVVVKKQSSIAKLIESAYYGVFHSEPPLLVCIVLPREFHTGEAHRGMKNGRLGVYEAMLSVSMPGIIMSLAAEGMGISSCLITVDDEKAAPIIGLRKGDRVPLVVGLGFADRKAHSHGMTHHRHQLASLVHMEKFRAD